MVNLGVLERQAGNVDVARDWYRRAVESGHDDGRQRHVNLGVLEDEAGNVDVARDWGGRSSRSRRLGAEPMVNLGVLETGRGMWMAPLVGAAVIGSRRLAPNAMVNLGVLEDGAGNVDWPAAVGSHDWAPNAMSTSVSWRTRRECDVARDWTAGGGVTHCPTMVNLGVLETRGMWMWPATGGGGRRSTHAPNPVTRVLETGGEWEARTRRRVGRTTTAPNAMVNLGVLDTGRGMWSPTGGAGGRAGHDDRRRTPCQPRCLGDEAGNWMCPRLVGRAVESGHDDWAPKAMFNLAATYHALSGFTVARNWYTRAIEADSAEVSAFAALRLGDLELDIVGDPYAARAAYERAVAFDDPEQSPLAQLRMARLDAMELDDEAAEGRLGALAGVLLDSQIHAEILAIAGRLEHVERFAAAERWLQRVPSSSPLATAASLQLAGMFRRLGRGDDAYDMLASLPAVDADMQVQALLLRAALLTDSSHRYGSAASSTETSVERRTRVAETVAAIAACVAGLRAGVDGTDAACDGHPSPAAQQRESDPIVDLLAAATRLREIEA